MIQDETGTVHGRLHPVGDRFSLASIDPRLEYSLIAVGAKQSSKIRTITRGELIGDISEPSSSPAAVTASEIEGDGTEPNPFIIRTDSELQAIGNETAGLYSNDSYRLGDDIDASKTNGWNGENGFDPIEGFDGTFDGDGHRIFGLTIDWDSNQVGLFGDIAEGGEIRSVSVEDLSISGGDTVGGIVGKNGGTVRAVSVGYRGADIYPDDVSGDRNVGGLIGENTESGTIVDSSITGRITGENSEIAGLVGLNSGRVESSGSTATVTVANLDGRHVAGLVGTNKGVIVDSFSTGDVTVTDATDDYPRVGGLVGENFGTIERSYATGDLTSSPP